MKKKFKSRQLTQDAIPTTSLADMMFLLLIFFIMTTTLTRITGFTTDAPSGSKAQADVVQEKTPTVDLHGDKITVDGQNMGMDGLRNYIKNLHLERKTREGKVVIISATGAVSYQTYFEAMALVQTNGGVVAILRDEEGTDKK